MHISSARQSTTTSGWFCARNQINGAGRAAGSTTRPDRRSAERVAGHHREQRPRERHRNLSVFQSGGLPGSASPRQRFLWVGQPSRLVGGDRLCLASPLFHQRGSPLADFLKRPFRGHGASPGSIQRGSRNSIIMTSGNEAMRCSLQELLHRVLSVTMALFGGAAVLAAPPAENSYVASLRRLTEQEYGNSVADDICGQKNPEVPAKNAGSCNYKVPIRGQTPGCFWACFRPAWRMLIVKVF